MKILEVIPVLVSGGAERFIIDLCNELVQNNEMILVVSHSLEKYHFFTDELSPKVKIISMNKKMGLDIGLFFKLRKLILKEKPDIVHTHLSAIIHCALGFMFKSNIKFIHTIHNDAVREMNGKAGYFLRRFAFRSQRVIPVTISKESQKSFTDLYHLPSSLIPNGRPEYKYPTPNRIAEIRLELSQIKKEHNSELIVNVARIVPQKNQLVLAKAVHSLHLKGYKIELAIIGDETDAEITQQIKDLGSPYVHILKERNNPRDYMYVSDAFCLSSIYEGMPITLIECLSVGALPICTPVGGVINMIQNGYNGLLAKSTNQSDIEAVLIRFLKMTKKERTDMKKAAQKSFEEYNMRNCAISYEKLMKSLVN